MAVELFSQGSKQLSKSSVDGTFTFMDFLQEDSGELQRGFKISSAKNVLCGVEIENASSLSCEMKAKVYMTDKDQGDYLSTTDSVSSLTDAGVTSLTINFENLGAKYVDIEITVTAGSGDFQFFMSGNQ